MALSIISVTTASQGWYVLEGKDYSPIAVWLLVRDDKGNTYVTPGIAPDGDVFVPAPRGQGHEVSYLAP